MTQPKRQCLLNWQKFPSPHPTHGRSTEWLTQKGIAYCSLVITRSGRRGGVVGLTKKKWIKGRTRREQCGNRKHVNVGKMRMNERRGSWSFWLSLQWNSQRKNLYTWWKPPTLHILLPNCWIDCWPRHQPASGLATPLLPLPVLGLLAGQRSTFSIRGSVRMQPEMATSFHDCWMQSLRCSCS